MRFKNSSDPLWHYGRKFCSVWSEDTELNRKLKVIKYITYCNLPFPPWEILWWEDPKKFPRSPLKNTLVRKFPLFPPKRYSGGIKLNLPDLFYAKPGGPPLREYKQPMAMYITSPHPGPIKKKIRNWNIPRSPLKRYSGEKIPPFLSQGYSGEKIPKNSPVLPQKGTLVRIIC